MERKKKKESAYLNLFGFRLISAIVKMKCLL